MKGLWRRLFNLAAGVSLVLCLATMLLWVRTEWMELYETFDWSQTGAYHSLEFSSDDLDYRIMIDPGLTTKPLLRHTTQGGWIRPPTPSNLAAVPVFTRTLALPYPRSGDNETRKLWLPRLGFDYGEFAGWYGPGTIVYAYRISYFVVVIPTLAICLAWFAVQGWKWHRTRRRPGCCPKCGYDLRGSPERCPECGATAKAEMTP